MIKAKNMLSKISADKKKLQEKQRNAAAAESRKAQERLIPQSSEHMEWGWSAYEERQRLARRFILWDGFVAIIATVQFSLTSFFASFDPYNESLLWASGMLDYLFLVDICVNVYKFYIFDEQNADLRIGNSRLDNYLYGWFIADILAILPTDSISIMTYNPYNFYDFDLPLLAICRANRLLVGYKIFLFLDKMEAEVGSPFVAIRAVYYTLMTWVLLHATACIWYQIPCWHDDAWDRHETQYCTAPSWIFSGADPVNPSSFYGAMVPIPNKNIYAGMWDHGWGSRDYLLQTTRLDHVKINATVGQKYFYSLYWAITTMTSVGLGEVHAITPGEMLFALIAQLIGMIVLFGIIQGSITSILTNFDSIRFQYKHRISSIIHYLRDQNQSTELVRDVTDFYNYLWKRSQGMSSAGLFDELPFALRSEIAMELNGQIIDRSPLFQDLSSSFLRMLCLKFRPLLVLPGQIIMKKGELSDLMIYIQNGELEVLSDEENEVPVLLLKSGKLFGEINLITRMPRKYSIRAIAHCDLVVLRTKDLMDCLQSYPEIADELRQRAEERTGVVHQKVVEGLLAHTETHEAARQKKQQKELGERIEELKTEMGVNLRPLMTALNVERPQETLKLSESMELFKIRDPMDELVEYNMGSWKEKCASRYRRFRQTFWYDFSIDPEGLFYYFWERSLITMVLLTFFLNTYIGFFQSYDQLLGISVDSSGNVNAAAANQTTGVLIIVFDYVLDVFFIIDYGLKFVKQIVTANGKITDHKTMALRYVKSWGCYTDLLAVFPVEIFAVKLTYSNNSQLESMLKLLGYLKVNRALRVLTLPQFFDYLSADLNNSIPNVRVAKFVVYIGMFTQICAVFLFLTACDPSDCYYDPMFSWTAADPPGIQPISTTSHSGDIKSSKSYRYTSSLYWAVTMMATVGYGDIYPHNMLEQFVANIVMIIGTLMYGYCLAVLTATICNLDAPRVEFQERLFALINYMEYNRLAQAVQNRAIDSVALLWAVSQGEEIPGVKSMTADMPDHLMEGIQVDDLMHLIAGVPIFKNIEEQILKYLAPAIRRYLFPPGEFIIQTGDLISELFVIRRGFCSMFHPEDSTVCIAILHPGMYFGEIGFLFNKNEIASIKTITHCEVLTLPRSAFDEVAVNVEWLQHQVLRISQEKKYYEDLVSAAKNAKPYVRKRRQMSPVRMAEAERKKLRFKEDLNSVHVSRLGLYLYRFLRKDTIAMDSRFLHAWEYFRLAVVVVQFVLILVQCAFQIDTIPYFVILYVFDIHSIADIYLKFHVQYTNDMHIVVTHPFMTARRYIRSNFWMDFFAVFPFELFLCIVGGTTSEVDGFGRSEIFHWIMYVRINRLLQIYRVPLAFQYMENDIKVDPSSVFLYKYGTYWIIYIIFVTCIPLVIQCPPLTCATTKQGCYFKPQNTNRSDLQLVMDIDYGADEWEDHHRNNSLADHSFGSAFLSYLSHQTDSLLKRSKRSTSVTIFVQTDDDGYVNLDASQQCFSLSFLVFNNVSNQNTLTKFIASFYWAVTTTTSTGYGDFFAFTQIEQIIFIFTMISGTLFYGYIIACIAAAQANSDARRSRFFERLLAVKNYLSHESLQLSLRKRVVRYYEYLWLRTQGIDPQTLIVGLPPSLTGELALQLYKKVIDQIAIFKNTPMGFKKMLATIIKPLYILQGEYVTRIGDTGTDLFFLYRGSVEVQYRSGEFGFEIRSGRILGEVAFLTEQKAQTSFRAKENCDLYCLTKKEFDVVLDHFPEVREKLMEEAIESMEREADYQRLFEERPRPPTAEKGKESMPSLLFKPEETVHLKIKWRAARKHIFRSDDLFVRYFNKFTVTVLRLVSVMLILYQPTFYRFLPVFYPLHYILEFIFILDLVIRLRVGFLDKYGNEVLNPALIRQLYLKSRTGLILDILNLFPYELLAFAAPPGMGDITWGYLRLLRVPCRYIRIHQFFKSWLAELDITVLYVRLAFSFTQLAFWMHFFTCLAYYIACPNGVCDLNSWIKTTVLASNPDVDRGAPVSYIIALYWITNSVTSTGYGDIVPSTNLDRIFSLIVQLMGKMLFGFIIGDISSALANAEISRQTFESQFQAIKTYLLDQQANQPIIARVQNYFNYLWSTNRGITDINNVLRDAPFCLRTEIGYAVHNKDLRQLPLFREASEAFIRMLSAHLHQVQFVPGDFIIQQGDLVQEMYFIHRGEAVEVETGVETGSLRSGSNINWQAVLIDWPASRTVRATDNCEVYVLKRQSINEVVSSFPDEMELICTTTRTRLRDLLEEEHIELD